MIKTTQLKAAKKFGPGYFIREQMEMREWIQDDLAEVMGFTVKHLNKILQDKQPLTLDVARILGEVFNTTPEYWVNINTGYRLWLSQEKTDKEVEADIKSIIYERMPVKDMLAKGWLKPFKSAKDLTKQVLLFWGWDKLDFSILDEQYLPCLTRKSEAYNQFNASYAVTWYRKARNEAIHFPHLPYKKQKLEKIFEKLHSYTIDDDGINQLIKELEGAGVIFFVLPHLQKTYLDGAAFFSGKNPVIVFTGRYKRIDNFWFTIAHEIAHVLNHLDDETPFVLDNLKEGDVNKMETEANKLAAEKLKHTQIIQYLEPYMHYLTPSKVEECAAEYEVHPSIIIGKLAYEKKISYSNQSLYNENVLQFIKPQYQVLK
jgi:HTH-type transcriptional regulator / antitoxin HigA